MTEAAQVSDRESTHAPSAARLALLVLEGYAYLLLVVGIFVAASAYLVWGLLNQRPFVALTAIFVGVPLVVTTARSLRALAFSSPPAGGIVLTPAFGGGLLQAVDDIRRRVRAPRVHIVAITHSCNASAVQEPRLGVLWPRNTLLLGYPLLATLSADQMRAVIAHEVAHLTYVHGRLASWVYRTRMTWQRLMRDLGERGAIPIWAHLLFRWYVPRLDAQSAAVSRNQERLADRLAADVAGADVTAQALVAVEIGGYVLERVFWPNVCERVSDEPTPPRPFEEMTPAIWADIDDPAGLLHELLAFETIGTETHPSLRERLARLNERPQLPVAVTRSAASDFLGSDRQAIASRLDLEWQASQAEAWRRQHDVIRSDRERLARLQTIERPTRDQLFEQAELLEREGHDARALELYTAAHAAGHAAAGLAVGRLRLEREDETGLALVEAAMEGDPSLVGEGCDVAIDFLERRGRTTEASRLSARKTRHATLMKIASDERQAVTVVDRFETCADERVDASALSRRLAAEPSVSRAFLVSKVLRHSFGTQTVLVLAGNRLPDDLEQTLRRSGAVPDDVQVVILGRHDQQLQAALENTHGALVYEL